MLNQCEAHTALSKGTYNTLHGKLFLSSGPKGKIVSPGPFLSARLEYVSSERKAMKETRFSMTIDIGSSNIVEHGRYVGRTEPIGERLFVCYAVSVVEAIAKADAYCNETWPGRGVTFHIFRLPMPEGGYAF